MSDLPIVGAALTLKLFEELYDVMFEKNRDLELHDFHKPEILDGNIEPLIDQAKCLLNGYQGRHGIHGPFWDLPLASWDPQLCKLVQKRLTKGLEICEALGSTHMVIHSPYMAWEHNNILNYHGSRESIFERFTVTMKPIVKRAEDIGTMLVLENVEDIDPYFRGELTESMSSEAFQISVDTGHAYYAHESCGAPPVDYFIKAAGNRLQHIHLQDADGHADRHWALGDGAICWHSVFTTLSQLQSKPRLIIESFGQDAITRSIAYLQNVGLAE